MDVYLEIDHDTCPLCMNHIDINKNKQIDCNHNYCQSCIDEWLKTHCICPICDYNVNGNIQIIDNSDIVCSINNSEDIDISDSTNPYDNNYTSFNYNNIDFGFPKKALVYAHTYNFIRIMSGFGGLSYSK